MNSLNLVGDSVAPKLHMGSAGGDLIQELFHEKPFIPIFLKSNKKFQTINTTAFPTKKIDQDETRVLYSD